MVTRTWVTLYLEQRIVIDTARVFLSVGEVGKKKTATAATETPATTNEYSSWMGSIGGQGRPRMGDVGTHKLQLFAPLPACAWRLSAAPSTRFQPPLSAGRSPALAALPTSRPAGGIRPPRGVLDGRVLC